MSTFRSEALKVAMTQLGVTEHPPGSNWGPQVSEYLKSAGFNTPAPWCMAFVHWCYQKVGLHLGGGASVGFFEAWAKQNGDLVAPKSVMKGDIVCYRWDADDWPDHVGIVTVVGRLGIAIKAIEGNTGIGNDANGGKVMIRYRLRNRCKFVRIPGSRPDPHIEYRPVLREHGMIYIEPVEVT